MAGDVSDIQSVENGAYFIAGNKDGVVRVFEPGTTLSVTSLTLSPAAQINLFTPLPNSNFVFTFIEGFFILLEKTGPTTIIQDPRPGIINILHRTGIQVIVSDTLMYSTDTGDNVINIIDLTTFTLSRTISNPVPIDMFEPINPVFEKDKFLYGLGLYELIKFDILTEAQVILLDLGNPDYPYAIIELLGSRKFLIGSYGESTLRIYDDDSNTIEWSDVFPSLVVTDTLKSAYDPTLKRVAYVKELGAYYLNIFQIGFVPFTCHSECDSCNGNPLPADFRCLTCPTESPPRFKNSQNNCEKTCSTGFY
jgi:hypothetical protein